MLKAPATTANFGPGFDVFGAALDFYNELEVYPDNQFELNIYGEGSSKLARSENNLVYRAYEKTFKKKGKKLLASKFVLKNRIPLARGLGSSSSAALLGIMSAMKVLDIEKELNFAAKLAIEMEGHPDNVIPCLFGGLHICYSEDDNWKSVKLKNPDDLGVVLIVPKQRLSTEKARRALPKNISIKKAVFNVSRASLFVYALEKRKYNLLKEATRDEIHQKKRIKLIDKGEAVFSKVLENTNCITGWLSGAGSTFAFLTEKNKKDELSDFCEKIMKENDFEGRVLTSSFSKQGLIIKGDNNHGE